VERFSGPNPLLFVCVCMSALDEVKIELITIRFSSVRVAYLSMLRLRLSRIKDHEEACPSFRDPGYQGWTAKDVCTWFPRRRTFVCDTTRYTYLGGRHLTGEMKCSQPNAESNLLLHAGPKFSNGQSVGILVGPKEESGGHCFLGHR